MGADLQGAYGEPKVKEKAMEEETASNSMKETAAGKYLQTYEAHEAWGRNWVRPDAEKCRDCLVRKVPISVPRCPSWALWQQLGVPAACFSDRLLGQDIVPAPLRKAKDSRWC